MAFAMSVNEAAPLAFERSLDVGGARRYHKAAELQRLRRDVVHVVPPSADDRCEVARHPLRIGSAVLS